MENEKLLNLKNSALKEVEEANSVDSLNAVRNTYLSKKSELSSLTSQIGQLPPEERKAFGAALTEVRVAITTAIEEKMTYLKNKELEEKLEKEQIDISLPGVSYEPGGRDPFYVIQDEMIEIFLGMGFEVADGPEVEKDLYNFELLNIPKDHPARDMQDTFYINDNELLRTHTETLDLSHFDTGNVTDMYGMFLCCSALETLDVSHFDTGNVTDMTAMFNECTNLETLDLTSWNTGNVTDMTGLFFGCTNLTTIYAGAGWNTEKVFNSEEMFTYCTKLVGGMGTEFDADHIDKEYARIDRGEAAPGYLTGLFSITLPENIKHGMLAASQGDKVLVNGDMVVTGSTVTLSVAPEKGYKLQSLTVTIAGGEDEPSGALMRLRGGTVELTDGDEPNTYTFEMPAAPVEVNAVFKKSTPTDVDDINANKPTNGQRYNLLGQPVGPDYKGIVIENGRKIYVE